MPCVAEYLFWSLQQYLPPANSSEVFACPHWELESLFLTLTVSFQRAHKQQKAMDVKALWGYAVQGGTASALRLGTLTCHPTFQCLPRSHHAARKPKIFGVNILYSGPTTKQRERDAQHPQLQQTSKIRALFGFNLIPMLVVTLWHEPAWIMFSLKWLKKVSLAVLTPGSAGLSNFSQKNLGPLSLGSFEKNLIQSNSLFNRRLAKDK